MCAAGWSGGAQLANHVKLVATARLMLRGQPGASISVSELRSVSAQYWEDAADWTLREVLLGCRDAVDAGFVIEVSAGASGSDFGRHFMLNPPFDA